MAVTFKKLPLGNDWAVYKNGYRINSLTRPHGDAHAKWRLLFNVNHGLTKGEMIAVNVKLKELNSHVERS